jgi:hypothetical protein
MPLPIWLSRVLTGFNWLIGSFWCNGRRKVVSSLMLSAPVPTLVLPEYRICEVLVSFVCAYLSIWRYPNRVYGQLPISSAMLVCLQHLLRESCCCCEFIALQKFSTCRLNAYTANSNMVTSEELVDQQDYEEILEDIKEEVCIDTF